ncbi:MAG: hypothetical protein EXX96DRAFT_596545 [Benjaminiella poitrasii]|nr:MAG: hypothetical protein EXX96DRAFT_596545 [Benjaminiella poitrasii]
MLDCERRDNQIRQYNELIFINNAQDSYTVTSAKRKFRSKPATTTSDNNASVFEEADGIYINNANESLGTTIGRTARNLTVTDRKFRYFHALGMNGVIDLFGTSTGSQLSNFNQDFQAKLKQQFPIPTFSQTNSIGSQLEEIQNRLKGLRDDKSYLKKYVEKINQAKTVEKFNTTKRLYIFVLELLLYDNYIFNEDEAENLSENDYQVKVWGPLMETVSRGAPDKKMKMDSRVIANILTKQDIQDDTGTGEVSKKVEKSKFYKDKLESILFSKLNLNQRLDKSSFPVINAKTIFVPFAIIMSLEAVIYTLSMASNGFVLDVKNHEIEAMVSGFEVIKVKEKQSVIAFGMELCIHPFILMYIEISNKSQES